MKRQFTYIWVVLVAIAISSCELLVEATTNDEIDSFTYEINQQVREITVIEDMDIELVESEENKIVVNGPKAILDKFSIENKQGELSFNFKKMDGWKYDKPIVQIRMPSVVKLNLYAHNNVFANSVIKSDTINIYNDGTGDVTLSVDCNHFIADGTLVGIFYIDGKTDSLTVDNKYSSSFRGANLIAQYVTVHAKASNQQVVHPVKSMTCNMSQTGNVYYVNEPEELIVNYINNKKGRVIYDPNKE